MIDPTLKRSIVEIDEAKTARIEQLEKVLEEMLIASKDILRALEPSEIVKLNGEYDALCRAVVHAQAAKF